MNFPGNIYLLALVASAVTVGFTLPAWRVLARRSGLVDDPGDRKIHSESMPLAGGPALLTGLLLPVLLLVLLRPWNWLGSEAAEKISYGIGARALPLMVILAGAAGMTILGLLDDRYELRPALKFAGQFAVAVAVAAAGVRITLFIPSVLFSYAITVLWILTVTNAFNFMDNMNGLCAGLGAIAALWLGVIAARLDQYLVAATAGLICGALLGFLPWNYPRARAFLGDAGSHLVGYLMAVLAILPHFYSAKRPHAAAVLSPLLILAVPLLDLAWVVLLRWRMGRPFYIGDTNHLSHRLVRRGFAPPVAVALIWCLGAGLGSLALLLN